MKQIWAVSVCATKETPNGIDIDHCPFLVFAESRHEAIGLGTEVARRMHPMSEGWMRHHVAVSNNSNPITDPAKVEFVKKNPDG